MGFYGNVVLYPKLVPGKGLLRQILGPYDIPKEALLDPPEDVIKKIVSAFVNHGFLDEKASQEPVQSRYPYGNSHILYDNKELTHAHRQVSISSLKPRISELVFTTTPREIEGDLVDEEGADEQFVPTIDIVIFREIVYFTDSNPANRHEQEVCSWAFIEFGFEDFRFTEEVHSLRNPNHLILKDFGDIFHSRMDWGRMYW